MGVKKKRPEIVLFGDSLTEWGFDEDTRGFGWALQQAYKDKAVIVNEGIYTSTLLEPNFRRLVEQAVEPGAGQTLLVTIFLGANDACLPPWTAHVPLPRFEANIREFVETILSKEELYDTKIVLITPPPINIKSRKRAAPQDGDLGPAFAATVSKLSKEDRKQDRGYQTYLSKKRYGEKIMEIAKSFEHTGCVAGLNFWKALIDAALDDQQRLGDEDAYDEERLPGCGLEEAEEFGEGYFTDGLHLDGKSYDILSKGLVDLMLERWPELAPGKLEG
ncbi:SGNH hydrolase [Lojkania enalia]|uniref:SGNH hydrolase n=1 Tax=Lojkania enalia TaxID=147567 RepID=A0A9P4JZF2_9PLEO|nr:SGNH hydrolase [Didymosphaeria enalia]